MNRRYQDGEEFKARQGRFDFAEVALAVLEIAVSVKKSLCGWWKKVRPFVQVITKKPHQLVLELDGGIAQVPMF